MSGKEKDDWEEEARKAREKKRMAEEEAMKRKRELEEAREKEEELDRQEAMARRELRRLEGMVFSMSLKLEKLNVEKKMAQGKRKLMEGYHGEACSKR